MYKKHVTVTLDVFSFDNELVTHVKNLFIKQEYMLHYYKIVLDMYDIFNLQCIPFSGTYEMLVTCRDILQCEQNYQYLTNHPFQSLTLTKQRNKDGMEPSFLLFQI